MKLRTQQAINYFENEPEKERSKRRREEMSQSGKATEKLRSQRRRGAIEDSSMARERVDAEKERSKRRRENVGQSGKVTERLRSQRRRDAMLVSSKERERIRRQERRVAKDRCNIFRSSDGLGHAEVPAWAFTINKSQGQTLKTVGGMLRTDVFAHGQLYTLISRAGNQNRIKILSPTSSVRNVVYKAVFQ
jgi:hypothetical protein